MKKPILAEITECPSRSVTPLTHVPLPLGSKLQALVPILRTVLNLRNNGVPVTGQTDNRTRVTFSFQYNSSNVLPLRRSHPHTVHEGGSEHQAAFYSKAVVRQPFQGVFTE